MHILYTDRDTQRHKLLIKLILSLAFAEKVDLGFDPSVTAKYSKNQRVYEFKISGKTYITSTSKLISDIKADGVYTTGTRIYKAFLAEDKKMKKPYIIKDYWPAENHDSEDVICRLIHDDIEDADEKTIFKTSTFTPIASERVKIGKNYEHTRNTILRGGEPTGTCKIKLPKEKSEIKSGKINAVG